jgi:hypothetical protein
MLSMILSCWKAEALQHMGPAVQHGERAVMCERLLLPGLSVSAIHHSENLCGTVLFSLSCSPEC